MTIKEVITERDRKGYIQFDGQNVLMLASNDYLGLSTDPDVIAGATAACNRYGTGMAIYPAFITSDEHRALERELAKFLEVDAVILTASGGAANAVALTGLVGKGDIIFSDADNHASTIDAGRLSRADVIPFATRNPRDLRNRMSNVPKTGRKLIVTNGVFSMDGGLAPLVELIDICQEYDALLVVDDAHGTGVVGECGQGSLSAATVGSHEQADVL